MVGTDTVEVSGVVNVGKEALNSSGLRVKKSGSITLKSTGVVTVEGKKELWSYCRRRTI